MSKTENIPMTLDEAIVDVYRAALRRESQAGATALAPVPSSVPGTGRSCRPNHFVASKRIKALHRSLGRGLSLRAFARNIVATEAVSQLHRRVALRLDASVVSAPQGCDRRVHPRQSATHGQPMTRRILTRALRNTIIASVALLLWLDSRGN